MLVSARLTASCQRSPQYLHSLFSFLRLNSYSSRSPLRRYRQVALAPAWCQAVSQLRITDQWLKSQAFKLKRLDTAIRQSRRLTCTPRAFRAYTRMCVNLRSLSRLHSSRNVKVIRNPQQHSLPIRQIMTAPGRDVTHQSDIAKMKTEPDGSFKRAAAAFRNTVEKGGKFEPEPGKSQIRPGRRKGLCQELYRSVSSLCVVRMSCVSLWQLMLGLDDQHLTLHGQLGQLGH